MRKYLGAIAATLFFVGLVALAANLNSYDSEEEFFGYPADTSSYVLLPRMNITGYNLSMWNRYNYLRYDNYWINIRNSSGGFIEYNRTGYVANVSILFDAYGNASNSGSGTLEMYQTAQIFIVGPSYGSPTVFVDSSISNLDGCLSSYASNVLRVVLNEAYYNIRNSSSNDTNNTNTTNYTNNTNSTTQNTSNSSSVYFPDPLYGPQNLSVRLIPRNISVGQNMSIYVYNASFIGNTTYNKDFKGRIYAKFNINALVGAGGWYSSRHFFYDQDIVFDMPFTYSCNAYYNYSLLSDSVTLRDLLFSYYWSYAQSEIYQAINNSTSPDMKNLPSAYLTGYNLSQWYNCSYCDFSNYTSVGYQVIVTNANFSGGVGSWNVTGTINLNFDAYGNNSYTPPYYQNQTWEYSVGARIEIYNSWVSSITFDRQLAIYPSDLRNFLNAWVVNVVNPYLLSNSSGNTTLVFPEVNITGYTLTNWTQGYYLNYTIAGYYVYVYNFAPNLQQYGNDVYGYVNFSFVAFGNDTNDSCAWWQACSKVVVYDNATIRVNGVQPNASSPDIYVNWYLRVNSSDVQNFLRGYFYAVMAPTITYYYNLTHNTTNRTIYLPSYYNNSQVNIDCSQYSWWYCSGANPQSYIYFNRAVGNNFSITVNNQGSGYFNGQLMMPYTANLINFTSTYEGKETIVDNLQGNATLYLFGQVSSTRNNTYYVKLEQYAYASASFDRNYFVQNAVQQVFYDMYSRRVEDFINSVLPNSTNY